MTIDIEQTGKLLKRLCDQQGITVGQIQSALYLKSQQSIYRWFRGETLPSINHFCVIANRLHLPMEALIVLKDHSMTREHIADMIRWTGDMAVDSDYLRKIYWEVLGTLLYVSTD